MAKYEVDTLNGRRKVEYFTPAEFAASGRLIQPLAEEMTAAERAAADVAQAAYENALRVQREAQKVYEFAHALITRDADDETRADCEAARLEYMRAVEATNAAYGRVNTLFAERRERRAAELAAKSAAPVPEQADHTAERKRRLARLREWMAAGGRPRKQGGEDGQRSAFILPSA